MRTPGKIYLRVLKMSIILLCTAMGTNVIAQIKKDRPGKTTTKEYGPPDTTKNTASQQVQTSKENRITSPNVQQKKQVKKTDTTSKAKPVSDSAPIDSRPKNRRLTGVQYNSLNARWLFITSGPVGEVYAAADLQSGLHLATPVKIRAENTMFNTAGDTVYFFGSGKYIEYKPLPEKYDLLENMCTGCTIDSIKPAQKINSIALSDSRPGYAIIQQDSVNYLFKKAGNEWKLNPLVITNGQEFSGSPIVKDVFYVVCLLLIALIALCLFRLFTINKALEKQINPKKENALLTKSEKPIGLHNQDLLGFTALEDAVLSIIKNPQTELPMSIVINGNWGSGKSSMMNRIRERLEADGERRSSFITTWFNVWHLQGESSLLNTFLLNVIQAYERDYTFSFRFRLAVKRFLRLPAFKQLAFGFAIAVIGPFLLLVFIKLMPFLDLRQFQFIEDYCIAIRNIFSGSIFTTGFNLQSLKPVAALLFAAVSYFFLNKQFMPTGLSAFFELLPKNSFRLDAEAAAPGYREKFKKEYWEIVDAGRKDKRLVVFIDDIDRISGDKILELLEGINFISDIASRPNGTSREAPNTIFILGMYMAEVSKNLGKQLEKINGTDNSDSVRAGSLGSRYLEKMIQLIVPVPFDTTNEKINYLYENE